jgi:putative PLP-dependent aminotransferase (TIGR04422 family)
MKEFIENSGDVWPKRRCCGFKFVMCDATKIEKILERKFQGGYPVVMSSGRAGIAAAVGAFYRLENIKIFPYASQCVVDSILSTARIPITPFDLSSLDISYNQWGRYNHNLAEPPFLEDSVDSFYPVGAEVLRSGAQFELWSTSKIFGLNYGAILWCKNRDDADSLRLKRDLKSFPLKYLRTILRELRSFSRFAYIKWQKLEFSNLALTKIEYGQMYSCILRWEELYLQRREYFIKSVNRLNLGHISKNLENQDVIPTIIEVSLALEIDKTEDVRKLHRIVDSQEIRLIRVIPYQVKL